MVHVLAVQLNEAGTRHESVRSKKIVVLRSNIEGVLGPDYARGCHSELHRQRQLVGIALEVSQVRNADAPFKSWRPEEYCLWPCWMIPERAEARSEARRHIYY